MMELNGFLREYGCPYEALTEGPLSDRSVQVLGLCFICFLLRIPEVRLALAHRQGFGVVFSCPQSS